MAHSRPPILQVSQGPLEKPDLQRSQSSPMVPASPKTDDSPTTQSYYDDITIPETGVTQPRPNTAPPLSDGRPLASSVHFLSTPNLPRMDLLGADSPPKRSILSPLQEEPPVQTDLESDPQKAPPAPAAPQGYGGWFRSKVAEYGHWAWNKTKEYGTKVGKVFLSGATAAPTAMNAFTAPSDSDPKDIGSAWWTHLSDGMKVKSLWYALASFIINIQVAYAFVPVALEKFKNSLGKCTNSLNDFIDNSSTLFLGTTAAIATSAIAYAAFIWAGALIAGMITVLNGLIYFATRYVGVKNFLNKLYALKDPDMQILRDSLAALRNLNTQYLTEVNDLIKTKHTKYQGFTDETIREITLELENLAAKYTDLIKEIKTTDYLADYAGLVFDLTMAIIVAGFAFPTFTQKGFDGINLLTGSSLDNLDYFSKGVIGLPAGLASAMLYAMQALDSRQIALDIWAELRDQPTQKLFFVLNTLVIAAFNYFASSSMENVSKGVLKREDRIFSMFETESVIGTIYVKTNRIGCGLVNWKASASLNSGYRPDLHGFIKALRTKDIQTKPSTETLSALQQFSMLRAVKNPEDPSYHRLADEKSESVLQNSR